MRRFDSCYPSQILYDPLAQSAEHLTFNQGVRSSNLRWVTKFFRIHMERCPSGLRSWSWKPVIPKGTVGSNPTLSATLESPLGYDIYPLYWITSKGGILMRYSYEFKRKAIELFYLNTKLWDTMVLLINLKVDHQRIAKWNILWFWKRICII